MEILVKLKLAYDSTTLAISNFLSKKSVKYTYIALYWLMAIVIGLKYYMDGKITGIYVLITIVLSLRAFHYTTDYLNNKFSVK